MKPFASYKVACNGIAMPDIFAAFSHRPAESWDGFDGQHNRERAIARAGLPHENFTIRYRNRLACNPALSQGV